jgi:magnesium transporter
MINILAEQSSHSFDWIDVENPSVQELQEIASRYGLHQSSVEDCLDPDHLPKYEEIEDTFFIVLRVFDPQSKPDSDTIQEVSRKISIFHSGKQLITIHRSPQPFLTHLKAKYVDTHKAENELQLLCAIVQKVLMSYEDPADKLSAEIDFYESKIFLKSRTPDLLKSLYRIKRKSSVIRRILILSKDILNRLEGKKIKGTVIRELHDRYLMIDMSYDQIWEEIHTLLSLYLSISSQKTNEVIRVLTIFSVFFMPLTFIVGIYGMNFRWMPELQWQYGYPASILVMMLITGVIYMWFKRKGWL